MRQRGFTLLEVVVALTIAALALGLIFSLLAGSKRLALRAEAQIERTLYLRAALNVGQVEVDGSDYPETPAELRQRYPLSPGEALEPPEPPGVKILYQLETYRLGEDAEADDTLASVRWRRLEAIPQ